MTALPAAFRVVPTGPLSGSIAAPASKSVTNRLLLIAALADGTSHLHHPLVSDDAEAMASVCIGLGAAIWPADARHAAPGLHVAGTGGRVSDGDRPLDCRLSGTTMRFGLAAAALSAHGVTLTGAAPLLRRPLGPLADALRTLGASVRDSDGFPPVTAGGGLRGGQVDIDVTGSSQYASAVLMAAPYAERDVTVRATGEHAAAYVELTVDTMDEWGATVDRLGPGAWQVTAGRGYTARDVTVEYDASAAAHLMALGVATGGSVTIPNAAEETLQPDAALPDVLARFGASIARQGGERLTVTGPDRPQAPGRLDLSSMPDQVTTVACLAALAEGETVISGVEVVRGHETDRLAALAGELVKVGAAVEERPDGLVIDGSRASGGVDADHPAVLNTHDDHRLAMAFASVAARLPHVVIDDPGCVAKTYPDFWKAFVRLGGEVHPL